MNRFLKIFFLPIWMLDCFFLYLFETNRPPFTLEKWCEMAVNSPFTYLFSLLVWGSMFWLAYLIYTFPY